MGRPSGCARAGDSRSPRRRSDPRRRGFIHEAYRSPYHPAMPPEKDPTPVPQTSRRTFLRWGAGVTAVGAATFGVGPVVQALRHGFRELVARETG